MKLSLLITAQPINQKRLPAVIRLKIIDEKEKRVAIARQKGFNEARGDIIASTDADTIPADDWLKMIDSHFVNNPFSLAVTGSWRFLGKKKFVCAILNIFCPLVILLDQIVFGSFLGGSNFAVRKSVFNQVGGFNTKLLVYEDVDLSLRLNKIGKVSREQKIRVSTSARRWEECIVSFKKFKELLLIYIFNFFSQAIYRKPKFNHFYDIRSKTEVNEQSKD